MKKIKYKHFQNCRKPQRIDGNLMLGVNIEELPTQLTCTSPMFPELHNKIWGVSQKDVEGIEPMLRRNKYTGKQHPRVFVNPDDLVRLR